MKYSWFVYDQTLSVLVFFLFSTSILGETHNMYIGNGNFSHNLTHITDSISENLSDSDLESRDVSFHEIYFCEMKT